MFGIRKETLVRLLLSDGLETVEAWVAALDGEDADGGIVGAVVDSEGNGDQVCAPLIRAINEVVPHLPDYKSVSAKLTALLSYAKEEYSSQVNELIQEWLCDRRHTVRFRRWILLDWLKCSHLTAADPHELLQWRHTLFVAAINEKVKQLKRALVDYLNTVDETIVEQFKDCKVTTETADTAIPSMKTVEELLDFCFLHAEQLTTCSLLCAAKLHALAVRTQRSSARLAEDDEVLVRLRWSLLLKPVLFKPLLQHAVALKTMSGKITTWQLWNSEELGRLVGLVDVTDRVAVLEEMRASRDELERGFRAGVEHIHSSASTSKKQSALETLVAEYLGSLSDEKRKSLMAELERDLDEAPPHLFLSVFLFFGLILKAMTLFSVSEEQEQDQVVEAVSILCALFDRRSHDPSSCLDVLSLLVRFHGPSNLIWHNNALYLQTIESLSATATLQVEPKFKWATRMVLHQLIFECDVRLLIQNKVNLSKILPPRTMRQVSIRLGAY